MNDNISRGDRLTVTCVRPAHGGAAIALGPDGKIIFVTGCVPGDEAVVRITKTGKSFNQARLLSLEDLVVASPLRAETLRCPAAAAGAGCCDFAMVRPTSELGLKREILVDQLVRIGRFDKDAVNRLLEVHDLHHPTGWRVRMRFGVDRQGRAGLRKAQSNDLVTGVPCAQAAEGMLDGIFDETFTPGTELVVALDSEGTRHVVECDPPARGKRTERAVRVVSGTGIAVEEVGGLRWEIPATAFWQGHRDAPAAYARIIHDRVLAAATGLRPVGWDLYGGAGVHAPALGAALDAAVARRHGGYAAVDEYKKTHDTTHTGAVVVTVEMSPDASVAARRALEGQPVDVRNGDVGALIPQLPAPGAIVIDPPRTGAGSNVIAAAAEASPEVVIAIGCDPATFARDVAAWRRFGYEVAALDLVDAFPGTHHMEAFAQLVPAGTEHDQHKRGVSSKEGDHSLAPHHTRRVD